MFNKNLLFSLVWVVTLVSCNDSETDFPVQEVTLFDKTWIASDGVESIRYRLNSDGTYNGGNDEGFPNQGTWNWVSEAEEVMRITYDNTTLWYRFEDLTSNSVRTFTSEVQPYEWDEGVLFSLSD
jgi:hypothetical protein